MFVFDFTVQQDPGGATLCTSTKKHLHEADRPHGGSLLNDATCASKAAQTFRRHPPQGQTRRHLNCRTEKSQLLGIKPS